ncbi:MAG TPA: hypothetical protein VFV60_06180, partial [bacterium]|nr:hypothetical protein [bacterium]
GKPLLRALEHFFAIPAPGGEGAGGLVVDLSVGVGVLGIIAGAALTRDRRDLPLGPIGAFFRRQWFIEDAYRLFLVSPAAWLARLLAGTIEVRTIDGTVNAVAGGIGRLASGLRQLQSGYVRAYATVILAGTILVLGYWLWRL